MRALVIALVLLFASGAASGAPDPKAVAHYKQGKAFLDAKDYDRAIVEFEAAYAIDKKSLHLYNIAKAYDAKLEFEKAVTFYQRFLDSDPPPDKKLADEVRVLIVAATKARDEAIAKKKADEEAARIAAENKRLQDEAAAKKIAAASRVKNAEAFAKAGAWVDAGNEHRAAFDADGDPSHLIAAGDAYQKADLPKARDAYRAYLDKVPAGAEADAVRGKLADTTKAIEKLEADERERKAREAADRERLDREAKNREKPGRPPHKSFKRGWIVVGAGMILTGLVADLKSPNADNGVLDASDFVGPALYGLGSLAVLRGVF